MKDTIRLPENTAKPDDWLPSDGRDDKVEDGTICCVEIDWFSRGDKRQELKYQTMWKEKPEGQK